MESDHVRRLARAVNFAAVKHKDQRRKDPEGTPYINHPIGVLNILVEEGDVTDIDVLVAAVLHDTVEDTDTSLDELQHVFGEKVRSIVAEVTDDKSLPREERKRQQELHAPTCSGQAKLVKLADKLYNLRDLTRATPVGWDPERVQQYFEWASRVVAGLRGANPAIEAKLDTLFQQRML